MNEPDLLRRITSDPSILAGKPTVCGGLLVECVLSMLAAGDTPEDVIRAHPDLKVEDIRACHFYAYKLVEDDKVDPGIMAEKHISLLTGGTREYRLSPHDITLADGRTLEVKYSGIRRCNRWQWRKVFGDFGRKEFSNLILVGEPNQQFRSHYKDPDSRYVLFDVPFSEVKTLMTAKDKQQMISRNSIPRRKDRSATRELFSRYEITESELRTRFKGSSLCASADANA